MNLTLHSDYALRLLMLLALEPAERHTIASVAQRYRISRHHLTKVTQTLVHAGLIESARGRGGGLSLQRPPQAVTVGEVVRATEDSFAIVECMRPAKSHCVIAPACGLRGPLQEALAAFLVVLDRYSLADLIANPTGLRRLRQLLVVGAQPTRNAGVSIIGSSGGR